MKKNYFLLVGFIFMTQLTACSPINSVQPFDDKQAAYIARHW